MTARANEELVKGEQALSIMKLYLGQGNFVGFCVRLNNLSHCCASLIRKKWQQYAVKSSGLRIDRHDRLRSHIFRRTGYEPVLAQGYDQILFLKLERRDKHSVNQLLRHFEIEGAAE